MQATRERRGQRRAAIDGSAVLFLEGIELGMFGIDNLSTAGALLTGDVLAAQGDQITVLLLLSDRAPIEVDAQVVRIDGSHGSLLRLGVEFDHNSSATEDAIRAALGWGPPAPLVGRSIGDVYDPDFITIVPEPR